MHGMTHKWKWVTTRQIFLFIHNVAPKSTTALVQNTNWALSFAPTNKLNKQFLQSCQEWHCGLPNLWCHGWAQERKVNSHLQRSQGNWHSFQFCTIAMAKFLLSSKVKPDIHAKLWVHCRGNLCTFQKPLIVTKSTNLQLKQLPLWHSLALTQLSLIPCMKWATLLFVAGLCLCKLCCWQLWSFFFLFSCSSTSVSVWFCLFCLLNFFWSEACSWCGTSHSKVFPPNVAKNPKKAKIPIIPKMSSFPQNEILRYSVMWVHMKATTNFGRCGRTKNCFCPQKSKFHGREGQHMSTGSRVGKGRLVSRTHTHTRTLKQKQSWNDFSPWSHCCNRHGPTKAMSHFRFSSPTITLGVCLANDIDITILVEATQCGREHNESLQVPNFVFFLWHSTDFHNPLSRIIHVCIDTGWQSFVAWMDCLPLFCAQCHLPCRGRWSLFQNVALAHFPTLAWSHEHCGMDRR